MIFIAKYGKMILSYQYFLVFLKVKVKLNQNWQLVREIVGLRFYKYYTFAWRWQIITMNNNTDSSKIYGGFCSEENIKDVFLMFSN